MHQKPRRATLCKLLTLVLLLTASSITSAACYVYYCSAPIQTLYVQDNGAYIQFSGDLSGLTNCTPLGGTYIYLPKSNPNYASIYATLLAARVAEQSISIRTIDGSNSCQLSYITFP
jgi:hypothetical protein